jgi:hypothetical protein
MKPCTTAVMLYGRFQPPTKAHEKLFDKYLEVAYAQKDKVYGAIFISPSTDKKSNPLSLDTRYQFLSKLYPHLDFVADPEIKNPFDAVHFLGGLGHKRIILIAGSDQAGRLRQQLNKYIHHPDPELAFLNVESIEVVEFGKRDPDSSDFIESLSATKARQAVKDKDFNCFCEAIPQCGIEDQDKLYCAIVDGMK